MASISVPCPKIYGRLGSGGGSSNPKLRKQSRVFFPRALEPCAKINQSAASKSRLKVSEVDSNSAPAVEDKSSTDLSNGKAKAEGSKTQDPEALSAFMTQVIDLIRLVDSKDIVELELKQSDSEIVIRKKEALQPQPAAPVYAMPPPLAQTAPAPTPLIAPAPSLSSPAPPEKATAPATPAKAGQSSHPSMKSPMAGTFYRSPAPGEPPFVKVGDKVEKGKVICIIEAMKLMNEIEADRDGTIADILVEDGKAVSVDTPLVVIAP